MRISNDRVSIVQMKEELVSIIMLSHNKGSFVEKSVQSIISQSYQNWELLFVDDSSKDDTLNKLMNLRGHDPRIKVSFTVFENGAAMHLNSALKSAKGRWIAFINCGDMWEPEKLKKQVNFMQQNEYSFSYTKYRMQNERGIDYGFVIGGKQKVTYKDLIKCCWLCFPTVMYDAEKMGCMQIRNLQESNDYALWLKAAKKADCYLLEESLTTQLTNMHLYSPFPFFYKLKWRYEVYHTEIKKNSLLSFLMAIRCLWGGFLKKYRYAEKDN